MHAPYGLRTSALAHLNMASTQEEEPLFKHGHQIPRNHDEAMLIDGLAGNNKWEESEKIEFNRLAQLANEHGKWMYDVKHNGQYKSRFIRTDNATVHEDPDTDDSESSPPPLLSRSYDIDSSSDEEPFRTSESSPQPLVRNDPNDESFEAERAEAERAEQEAIAVEFEAGRAERKAIAEERFYRYDRKRRSMEQLRECFKDNGVPASWHKMEEDFRKGDW
jgi:hypothetical protein